MNFFYFYGSILDFLLSIIVSSGLLKPFKEITNWFCGFCLQLVLRKGIVATGHNFFLFFISIFCRNQTGQFVLFVGVFTFDVLFVALDL